MKRFDYYFDGGTLVCWLEYERPDPEVNYQGGAFLQSALAEGVDVLELLDAKVIKTIEHDAYDAFWEDEREDREERRSRWPSLHYY